MAVDKIKALISNLIKSSKNSALNEDAIISVITRYGKSICYNREEKIKFLENLTLFEKKLYFILLEGYTIKEASKQLGIRCFKARLFQKSIFKKLHINTHAELIINYHDIGEG